MIRPTLAFVLFLATVQACTDHKSPQEEYDQTRNRRVYKPPPGQVRPVPPHAIHETGVGPYTLGASLREILGLLQRGPRVVLMQIDGLVDYSLVRSEQDGLLIGVEHPAGVSFLTVTQKEIALTESGVGVSTTEPKLREAMGPVLRAPHLLMNPRMVGFAGLPNVRFVLGDKSSEPTHASQEGGTGRTAMPVAEPVREVIAVVVRRDMGAWMLPAAATAPAVSAAATPASEPGPVPAAARGPAPGTASPPPAAKPGGAQAAPAGLAAPGTPAAPGDAAVPAVKPEDARRCHALANHTQEVVAVARLAEPTVAVLAGCFAGAPEAAVVTAERVVVVGGEPGKLRRLTTYSSAGITLASILDMDGDSNAEIALVSEAVTDEERLVRAEILRMEGGRLSPVLAEEVYRLSATKAAWIGAQLGDVELLIELWASADSVRVTGLYLQKGSPPVVVPLQVKNFTVRRKRPVPGTPGGTADDTAAPVMAEPAQAPPVPLPDDAGSP